MRMHALTILFSFVTLSFITLTGACGPDAPASSDVEIAPRSATVDGSLLVAADRASDSLHKLNLMSLRHSHTPELDSILPHVRDWSNQLSTIVFDLNRTTAAARSDAASLRLHMDRLSSECVFSKPDSQLIGILLERAVKQAGELQTKFNLIAAQHSQAFANQVPYFEKFPVSIEPLRKMASSHLETLRAMTQDLTKLRSNINIATIIESLRSVKLAIPSGNDSIAPADLEYISRVLTDLYPHLDAINLIVGKK